MSEYALDSEITIGLALSGGGVRAAAFHAGVLHYLAEQHQLEKVIHVSSVSGGSLFMGLVLSTAQYGWPSSSGYVSTVLPQVKAILTTKSLQNSAILRLLFNPLNWQFLLSRANVVAKTIVALWGIDAPLSSISKVPIWSINGTTAETGRRFRFKSCGMGDYELGYADASTFSLASAMAVSAAFPGGIGPLAISTRDFQWFKKPHWDAPKEKLISNLPFKQIHLYDGGLYDNLGIEPLFDIGTQLPKRAGTDQVNYIVVSDAGAALGRTSLPHRFNPFRFKRIADIALEQTRALRVRSFVNFLKRHPADGAYLQIGANPVETIKRFMRGRENIAERLLGMDWLQASAIETAAKYPTTLQRLAASDFDLLARHGWETARWNDKLLGRGYLNQA